MPNQYEPAASDTATAIARSMSWRGMADMREMEMQIPDNTLPMTAGRAG